MIKWRIIAIAFLYVLSTIGVHVQIHWCCGHLSGIEWNPSLDDAACSDRACCSTEKCSSTTLIEGSLDQDHLGSRCIVPALAVVVDWGGNAYVRPACSVEPNLCFPKPDYSSPPPLGGKSLLRSVHHWKWDCSNFTLA